MRACFNIGTRGEMPSSALSGTFSHRVATGEGKIIETCIPFSRPKDGRRRREATDEGSFGSGTRGSTPSSALSGTFSHRVATGEGEIIVTCIPFSRPKDGRRWPTKPDEGSFRRRDSWREALIRPSGTFSHRVATGEGKHQHESLLPSGGWEKVAEGRMRALAA